MQEENTEKKLYTDLATVKLDFNAIDEWRKPDSDDIPVCSFLSFYEACGLQSALQEYYDKNDKAQIVAVENLLCNFYTLQRIKKYISHMWEVYSLDIDKDNHVFWDPNSKYGKAKHYPKKLKASINTSVLIDFMNFCPGIDDELPDNVIVFRVYEKEDNGGANADPASISA